VGFKCFEFNFSNYVGAGYRYMRIVSFVCARNMLAILSWVGLHLTFLYRHAPRRYVHGSAAAPLSKELPIMSLHRIIRRFSMDQQRQHCLTVHCAEVAFLDNLS
jgi:hypothetical protein